MARQYNVISADSHLDINPALWTHRVPAKVRDLAPKVVTLEDGADAIQIGAGRPRRISHLVHTGPKDQIHFQVFTFENAAGAGGPEKRLREQDQDGIDAEVLYSAVGNVSVLREHEDNEVYLALNHAYNQYLAEEYAAAAPDRLFPLGVIPTTGVADAVKELEYCARAGMKGVQIDKFPSGKGHPTPEDDRFWAASLDLGMPVSHHSDREITRMNGPSEPTFSYTKGLTGPDASAFGGDPMRMWYFRFAGEGLCAPLQMAFAGVFDRFPNLQIYWGETMIGWLPYALIQVDSNYDRYEEMGADLYGVESLERRPSEYMRDHNFWGFLSDPFGVELRHKIGVDKLLWGSDFPHRASDWPHSREAIERDFAEVSPDERYLMLAGNAIKFFHLDA